MQLTTAIAVCLTLAAAATLPATAEPINGEETFRRACAQCHGRTGRGMGAFPRLSGLTTEHVTDRLQSYRSGTEIGPNSALMYPVVREFTDEDIAALAAYIADTFK